MCAELHPDKKHPNYITVTIPIWGVQNDLNTSLHALEKKKHFHKNRAVLGATQLQSALMHVPAGTDLQENLNLFVHELRLNEE